MYVKPESEFGGELKSESGGREYFNANKYI